jgi:putative ABC transport system permease protein
MACMDALARDIRYGLRMLLKSPGFAFVTVITLALGIGAITAIFSAVNAAMLRPLPYHDPGRLFWITEIWHKQGDYASVPNPDYTNWSTQARSFAEMAAYDGGSDANLTGAGEPERTAIVSVTANFFHLLGIAPIRGRTFLPQEARSTGPSVVILSYDLWRNRFGLDPNIVGKSIALDGEASTIVGVLPAHFRFPDQNLRPQCIVPFKLPARVDWYAQSLTDTFVIGRLQPRVTPEQARGELTDINRRDFAEVSPAFVRMGRALMSVDVVSLQSKLFGDVRPTLLVLFAAVVFVLLIACANVANLQLVRSTVRQREFAVRVAIGARRSRLIQQLLTEGALLALTGGTLGLVVAGVGVRLIREFAPQNVAQLPHLTFDLRVLAFTLVTSCSAAVLFGMVPALTASKPNIQETLKDTGVRTSGASRSRRFRVLLGTIELALATVLLVGSGLLLRSFVLLSNVDPGFDPHNVLTARLQLPEAKYSTPASQWRFYEQVVDRVRTLPGVESAAAVDVLPLNGFTGSVAIRFEGQPSPPPGAAPSAPDTMVSPDYFRVMRVPLISGRFFDKRDGMHNDFPLIVNQTFSRHFFPNVDPIGKRVRVGAPDWPWRTIIGVVGDIKQLGVAQPEEPEMYRPYAASAADPVAAHETSFATTIVIRSRSNPLIVASAIRQQISKIDSSLPIFDIATMEQRLATSLAAPRFNATLLGFFAGLSLLLALVGIYGVISYFVSQRTHEIGIRMALGALPANVLRTVMSEALTITVAGIASGIGACFALMRYMAGLLFQTRTTDPLIIAAVCVGVGAVALEASYLPARRAIKVDPVTALRHE